MLKKSDVFGFDLPLHTSKFLTIWVITSLLVAGLSLAVTSPCWLLFPGLFIYGWVLLQKECWRRHSKAIIQCQHTSEGYWRLKTRAGKIFLVKLKTVPYCSRWVVVLRFQTVYRAKKMTLIVAYDAMTTDNFKILLSRLWR